MKSESLQGKRGNTAERINLTHTHFSTKRAQRGRPGTVSASEEDFFAEHAENLIGSDGISAEARKHCIPQKQQNKIPLYTTVSLLPLISSPCRL
jgi:hypothetical protein